MRESPTLTLGVTGRATLEDRNMRMTPGPPLEVGPNTLMMSREALMMATQEDHMTPIPINLNNPEVPTRATLNIPRVLTKAIHRSLIRATPNIPGVLTKAIHNTLIRAAPRDLEALIRAAPRDLEAPIKVRDPLSKLTTEVSMESATALMM